MAETEALAVTSSGITNEVSTKITKMQKAGFELPAGYNITNALASIKLEIEDKQLIEKCTQESIVKCLMKMATFGEDITKGHFYLIPYGKECTYSEDYRGKMMRVYRDTDVVRINAQVVYEGDEFVYGVNKYGALELVKHVPNLSNYNKEKVIAAYAILVHKDGSTTMEIMTIDQIKQAWSQGATKGNSPAHKNFPDQMAKKTVIGRACKLELARMSGDDNELLDPVDAITQQRDIANDGAKAAIDLDASGDVQEIQSTDANEEENYPI